LHLIGLAGFLIEQTYVCLSFCLTVSGTSYLNRTEATNVAKIVTTFLKSGVVPSQVYFLNFNKWVYIDTFSVNINIILNVKIDWCDNTL